MDRMRDSAAAKGKDLAKQQGEFFLRDMKRESWEIAPTPAELSAVAEKLKWRLKRKKGKTPGQELQRRIRARGTMARGWKITRIDSQKYRIRIWLEDDVGYSGKVDAEKGVTDKAEKKRGGEWKKKLDQLAERVTRDF